jgi:hypothetical protein
MTAALYAMRYVGNAGLGAGALYVGRGKVAGFDAGGGRYDGTYTEQGGRIKGQATLSAPTGATLVTGQMLPSGAKIPLTVDWPTNFADGNPHPINVGGKQVHVTFEKVSDLP